MGENANLKDHIRDPEYDLERARMEIDLFPAQLIGMCTAVVTNLN